MAFFITALFSYTLDYHFYKFFCELMETYIYKPTAYYTYLWKIHNKNYIMLLRLYLTYVFVKIIP